MHDLEPFYGWQDEYRAETDRFSPFFNIPDEERENYVHTIYNFYIHPEWDDIGSPTLFLKVLYVHYEHQFAIIEMIGEWNDAISNDIMFLKRNLIDDLIKNGISKFILIGENVLNFHADTTDYYEEWQEEIEENKGWIGLLNFSKPVIQEMQNCAILPYVSFVLEQEWAWRKLKPLALFSAIEMWMQHRISS